MPAEVNLKDIDIALIAATAEIIKTWASVDPDLPPERIADNFNKVYATIRQGVHHILSSS